MSALDRVGLVPPYTTGIGRRVSDPVWDAPRYVRTREGVYWHRVRSGQRFRRDGRVCWQYWCGQHATDADRTLATDIPPPGEPACATCEGRALGAGQEDSSLPVALAFEPRGLTPPTWCPGGGPRGAWTELSSSVGRCAVCGHLGGLRVRPYPHYGATFERHRPGPGLVEPCPFHAWSRFAERDGAAYCWPCEDGRVL